MLREYSKAKGKLFHHFSIQICVNLPKNHLLSYFYGMIIIDGRLIHKTLRRVKSEKKNDFSFMGYHVDVRHHLVCWSSRGKNTL
jgi:hypothetical protein